MISFIEPTAQNLIIFGGTGRTNATGLSAANLNDMWRFDFTTSLWTWISGSTNLNVSQSVVTRGVEVPGRNVMGQRSSALFSHKNDSSLVYVFGGRSRSRRFI